MFKCMECNRVPVLEENGVCPECAYELKSFMDRIVSICKNAGKNVWGDSPAEMVAEIVNERDELKERTTADTALYAKYQTSMEGIDQTYQEWLESELKAARKFQAAWEENTLKGMKWSST